MRRAPGMIAVACLLGLAACTSLDGDSIFASPDRGEARSTGTAVDDRRPAPELESFLDSIEGLSWQVTDSAQDGYSVYVLHFEQPVDHADPLGRSFSQRIILHHRHEVAPMVLYTSGYSIFVPEHLAELTVGMGANQINVEQRFFGESRPAETLAQDWAHLTIEAAANDHHRIVQALRDYYRDSWLSTGHSKGGMTSIYHRRFHPDDVDATVAYVAPISFGVPDSHYQEFTSELGTSQCGDTLRSAQLESLERYDELFPLAQAIADRSGLHFDRSGGHVMAFETAISNLEWSFWQNRGPGACALVPAVSATDSELFEFIRGTVGIGADDATIGMIDSYFFQASRELGFPLISREHLSGLLKHQGANTELLPLDAPSPTYDPTAMLDIQAWLDEQDAAQILFVYGDSDPWSGGAFDTSGCTSCPSFMAAGQSHRALLGDLDESGRAEALDAIEEWTGVRAILGTGSSVLNRYRSERFRIPPPIGLMQMPSR